MQRDHVERVTRVLLYSGGMDSYALAHLWRPDILLYVDMKTSYSDAEVNAVKRAHGASGKLVMTQLDLSRWELPNGIIPGRNLMLATIATNYAAPGALGVQIALAATAGDRVLDKSVPFAAQASGILTYMWQPQHWTNGLQVQVVLPAKHLSKRQLIVDYAMDGGSLQRLADQSFSCYHPTYSQQQWHVCGQCKPCIRKWVALMSLNDQCPKLSFDASEAVRTELLPSILDGTWDRGEDEANDVKAALEWYDYCRDAAEA